MKNQNLDQNQIILYSPNESISLEVLLENDTVWLTQEQIAILFGVKRPAITKHIRNIFETLELEEDSVCSILERTASHKVKILCCKLYKCTTFITFAL